MYATNSTGSVVEFSLRLVVLFTGSTLPIAGTDHVWPMSANSARSVFDGASLLGVPPTTPSWVSGLPRDHTTTGPWVCRDDFVNGPGDVTSRAVMYLPPMPRP